MHTNFKMTTVTPRLDCWSGLGTSQYKWVISTRQTSINSINSGCPGDPGRRRHPLELVPFWTPPGTETIVTFIYTAMNCSMDKRERWLIWVWKQCSVDEVLAKTSCTQREANGFSICKYLRMLQGSWSGGTLFLCHITSQIWSITGFLLGCVPHGRPQTLL